MITMSEAVMIVPTTIGMPNSRLSAIAEPMTSARSQAAMAISHSIHRKIVDRTRVMVAAGLRQIAPGDDAQLERQILQQHRREIRDQNDRKQQIAELRAACQVGCPVAGVHVADRDQQAGADEGQQCAPEARIFRDADRTMNFCQRSRAAILTPSLLHFAQGL